MIYEQLGNSIRKSINVSDEDLETILSYFKLVKKGKNEIYLKDNNALSAYLIENGIDASRLSSKGFGESMPVESNKTAKGKANNRRVEVKLVK